MIDEPVNRAVMIRCAGKTEKIISRQGYSVEITRVLRMKRKSHRSQVYQTCSGRLRVKLRESRREFVMRDEDGCETDCFAILARHVTGTFAFRILYLVFGIQRRYLDPTWILQILTSNRDSLRNRDLAHAIVTCFFGNFVHKFPRSLFPLFPHTHTR